MCNRPEFAFHARGQRRSTQEACTSIGRLDMAHHIPCTLACVDLVASTETNILEPQLMQLVQLAGLAGLVELMQLVQLVQPVVKSSQSLRGPGRPGAWKHQMD